MSPPPAKRAPARRRLLDAADRLFYGEGIQSVGIDRVIAEAGVAKGSLYYVFGSKDELVREYLDGRAEAWHRHVEERLPVRYATARERIVGVFELLGEGCDDPDYHGCPFINASAESPPGGVVESATDAHRAWIRDLLTGLAEAAGVGDPGALAAQLSLLYDGVMVSGQLDRPSDGAAAAQAAAGALVDAALRT